VGVAVGASVGFRVRWTVVGTSVGPEVGFSVVGSDVGDVFGAPVIDGADDGNDDEGCIVCSFAGLLVLVLSIICWTIGEGLDVEPCRTVVGLKVTLYSSVALSEGDRSLVFSGA
jgi:hypothetical protein